MHTLRIFLALSLVIGTTGCPGEDDGLPPVQVQGRFLSYAADEDIVVCEGTVPLTEAWMEAVALYLGMDPGQLLPTTYYFVDSSILEEMCSYSWGGCTDRRDGHIDIFSTHPVLDHELVHAIQSSSGWPRRQPLLQEGLASALDQDTPPLFYSFTPDEIDSAIEAKSALSNRYAYSVGHYLVYWMLTRYGPAEFERFWYATSRPTTAAEFRAAFQDIFGESLDQMLAETDILGPICPIPICVGEPLAWEQGTWRTESPRSCDDGAVVGYVGEDHHRLVRSDLVEITKAGSYDINVSENTNSHQRIEMISCQNSCEGWEIPAGKSYPIVLAQGLYRVTTAASDLDEPGITVEIRPSD